MHRGTIRASGTPAELKATLGDGATLDDVFRHYTGIPSTTSLTSEASVTSAAPSAPRAVSAEYGMLAGPPPSALRRPASMIITLCWVAIRKTRHDRTELYTLAIQPTLVTADLR